MISSHILSEISLLADDIGIIDHGALLEEESLAELEQKAVSISGLHSLILRRQQEFWNEISMKTIFPYRTTTICACTTLICLWGKL